MLYGKLFHRFAVEWEKDRSNSADRDLGIDKMPFSDDLNFKGKGLQRLSLNSEEKDWRDCNFATHLIKIR